MCGITGWIDLDADLSNQSHILENMVSTLSKRGPDASGIYLSAQAALGHRRLIVVDPEGGGQPMTRTWGEHKYTITYNGELYNTLELRQELELAGYRFFTRNSDTEVILMAYMHWGQECVCRFNGIFAFAIWDEGKRTLFMARDRLGVKPLFYYHKGRTLIFGSELKALLAHPEVRPEVDQSGLTDVLALGPSRTPGHGIYRGVNEVRPGHSLLFNHYGIKIHTYWALKSTPHPDDLETTALKVRHLLIDTVERQLVSDVPVCTFLSGGLDSSAITAIASHAFARDGLSPLNTYSLDYKDNDIYFKPDLFQPNSDAPYAKEVSEFLGTRHHVIEIDIPELAEALFPATMASDLPGMADVDSSLLLFCLAVKKSATVALSGESADEVFGGYPWLYKQAAQEENTFPWLRKAKERTHFLNPDLVASLQPEKYAIERYHQALSEVPYLEGETPLQQRMRQLFYLNITRFMPTLLDRKDRMSMGVGLEVRVPFCDHRLVEYVWNIPFEMKLTGDMPKGILRKALTGLLPEHVLYRPKSPFPKTHHPAYLAAVQEMILSVLDDPASPILPLINVKEVRAFALSDGSAFDKPFFGQLMRGPQYLAHLIQMNTWLKNYHVRLV